MSAQPAFDANTDAIVERIETEGYAVVEQLLPMEDVLEIKDALAPWLQGERMGRNDFEGLSSERVYALLAKAPPIAKIIENPVTLAVIDRLLPTNYLLSACLAINVHPGETPQRFHSDDSGSRFWKAPHSWCGISTIWSFDDFTGDNGADLTEAVEARLEAALEAGDSLDARLVLLAPPAGGIQPWVVERYRLEAG